MKVIVKINGVEILVNARAEEVDKIEIIVSDEINEENTAERQETGEVETVERRETVEVGTIENTMESGDGNEEVGPHYCNINCSYKFNEVKNSK